MLITITLLTTVLVSRRSTTDQLACRPGIAIRILGDVTKERVDIARKADNIFINMIKEAGHYDQVGRFLRSNFPQANSLPF